MGPLTVLSVVGKVFPGVASLGLFVAFAFFPHEATAAFMWAVHVEAAHITSMLERVIKASALHGCHVKGAGCPHVSTSR
jgi:hypothetical protein